MSVNDADTSLIMLTSVNHAVRPSVCLWRSALWLSGSAYRAKTCTSVF